MGPERSSLSCGNRRPATPIEELVCPSVHSAVILLKMSCTNYTDPRLSAIYDALNPPGPDAAFYTDLAGETPKSILDMGCGTGWLACALAERGHHVTGTDPASAMLEIARRRSGGDNVRWINVAAADLSSETQFDLIIMTGHVFQVFLTDQEVSAALGALRRHLAPGGRLAFETRAIRASVNGRSGLPARHRSTFRWPASASSTCITIPCRLPVRS
jgi:2-polyprenyl-3-methyl-5-hydroxy-6-metoxy-1,4-benzoquinol methylase